VEKLGQRRKQLTLSRVRWRKRLDVVSLDASESVNRFGGNTNIFCRIETELTLLESLLLSNFFRKFDRLNILLAVY